MKLSTCRPAALARSRHMPAFFLSIAQYSSSVMPAQHAEQPHSPRRYSRVCTLCCAEALHERVTLAECALDALSFIEDCSYINHSDQYHE